LDANENLGTFEDLQIHSLPFGHLGLISAYFQKLELKDFFDSLLPKNREHHISHGTAVLAFLLNGLSFSRRQLYLFPDFFRSLPTERLLGEGVKPEYLNDCVMGELLDKIYSFGPTELFARLVSHVQKHEHLDLSRFYADTTNFSVYGDYEADPLDPPPEKPAIQITIGHPKDGRWDLKRFVLSLLVNADGVPLFLKTHSGNASDHQTIKEAMVKVQESLKESLDEQECVFVADAAFYTEENIRNFAGRWVSRVPATITEANELLRADVLLKNDPDDERYSFYETTSQYGGVRQKWVLVHSKEMQNKMACTFEKRLSKQLEEGRKALLHLKNKEFACEADARKYASEWILKYPFLELTEVEIVRQKRRESGVRGRPKKDEVLREVCLIEGKLAINVEIEEKELNRLGRFILSSSAEEMNGREILNTYKEQMHVERGFRFLKNKSFLVSETYLKKPQRIEALAFIMVLCLMVYSLLEYRLREGLKKQGKTIPNSKKHPTDNPTMEWAFSFFTIIAEASVSIGGVVKNVSVTQPNDVNIVHTILSALGLSYENFYPWDLT
jgi:transposase